MKKYLLMLLCCALPAMAQDTVILQELPLEAPAAPATEEVKSLSQSQQTLNDLYVMIDNQNTAIQDLTSKLEQMEFQITQLTKKMETANQDITFRLKELENKPVAEPAKPIVIDKSSDKERYDFAYDYIKKGDYSEAQKLLTEFTKDFPKSNLLPNALYWLGETYYTQEQYENAVGFFADVFAQHKDSNKAPDALFKMGLSMKGLNNTEAACSAWKGLIAEYPKADATLKQRAQEEMKKLKCPS
ncbi:MAG: tol-pal system protein YbgF [Alphaproteobacteria bacterium]|nr:tol-pal system protein YbgF [Alphaproteobacteria bacterium]